MAENVYNYSKELLGLPQGLPVSAPVVKWKRVINTAGPTPRFALNIIIFLY